MSFETWDIKRGERTSTAATEEEARRACMNDRGRLLTIYIGDQIVASYRDGRDIALDEPPIENRCICPDPLDGRQVAGCMIHGWSTKAGA